MPPAPMAETTSYGPRRVPGPIGISCRGRGDCNGSGHLLFGGALQAELRDGRLAHLELLHLAGDRRRELVDELPVRRNLERGDAAAAEGDEVLVAYVRSR